jgi:hypothetical protein
VTIWIPIFVVVAAVAIVLQMVILFAMYRTMQKSSARMEGIASRLEEQSLPVLVASRAILEDAQPKIAEITANLAESTAIVRDNVAHVSEAAGEIVERARMRAVQMDEFVSNTLSKLELTTELVQHSVISPIRRIQSIVQAVSAGLSFLRASRARKKAGNNDSGVDVDVDEEMFI